MDVQLPGRAGPKPRFDDRQRLALQVDVVVRVGDLLLERPILNVVVGHVAQQRHQHVVVICDGGAEGGFVRLDGPAEAAPKIELPAEGESIIPLAEIPLDGKPETVADRHDVVGRLRAEGRARVVAVRILLLRKQIADRDPQLSPGGEHAKPRLAQREVLAISVADQAVENRIVEDPPPLAQVVRVGPHALVGGVDPGLGDRRLRGGSNSVRP